MRDHEPIASPNIFGIFYLVEPSTSTIAASTATASSALDVSTADILTREYVGAVIGDTRYPEGVVRTVTIRTARRGRRAGC